MSLVTKLAKIKAHRVMGIDASTNAIAFTIFYNRRPRHWGKIHLNGADVYEKAGDANKKIEALWKQYEVDYIAIEAAAFINSPKVAIQLAYVYGSIIGELVKQGAKVITVPAMTWQAHIDNPPLKKDEKAKIEKEFPGKSKSWYQNKGRELRKQRTMTFFNKKWKMNLTDNDVGDSAGIAYYAYNQLTKRQT